MVPYIKYYLVHNLLGFDLVPGFRLRLPHPALCRVPSCNVKLIPSLSTVFIPYFFLIRCLSAYIPSSLLCIAPCCQNHAFFNSSLASPSASMTILNYPFHPYTKGLIASIPKLGTKKKPGARLEEISGNVPSLDQRLPGCSFHPRCAWAMEKCKTQNPQLRQIEAQRQVSCHLEPGSL